MIRKRTAMRVLAAVGLIILGLITALASSSSAGPAIGLEIHHGSRVAPAVFVGSVHALPQRGRSADRAFPAPRPERETALGSGPKQALPGAEEPPPAAPATRTPAPDPSISFKGLDFNAWGDGWPPDTVGDVGPTQFVQAVNTSVGIFRKSDGVRLAAFTFDALWSAGGAGTPCHANNYGDPTVVYDPQSDRWIVADFSFAVDKRGNPVAPYYECIAVSKTSDPVNGGWYLYAIRTDDATHPWFADYPKMGIWPDGLYMTANMFDSSGSFKEVRVWAFNRGDLESGVAARNVVVDLATTAYFSLLPSNMRTATGAPPAGRPNLLIAESESAFAFEVWKFHVDYSGSGSTFTGPTNVSQAAYSVASGSVVTPGNAVDTLEDRLMMQAQYTNIGGVESVWVNHTVGCCGSSTPVGIQWAQINVTGGTVKTTPVQQQEYPRRTTTSIGGWAASRSIGAVTWRSATASRTRPRIRTSGTPAGSRATL